MILRFQSAPIGPDDNGEPADVRVHQLSLTEARVYVMPACTALFVFFSSLLGLWGLCWVLRACGVIALSDDHQDILPLVFGLIFGGGSFLCGLYCESQFAMQMKVLRDRNCEWGEFRIFDRKRALRRRTWLKRFRWALSSHGRG